MSPVADIRDSHVLDYPLPTLEWLNATLPAELDAHDILIHWFADFSAAMEAQNTNDILDLFLPTNSFWRDLLALTWDFRSFAGLDNVSQFLRNQLPLFSPNNFKLKSDGSSPVSVQKPYPDLCWISAMFSFTTTVGLCSGIVRLVPTHEVGVWKAHVVSTNLEDLHGFPEKCGLRRNAQPNHGMWNIQRENLMGELVHGRRDPTVVIVGAGHSGLTLAARLKAMDVSVLVVDKNERVGDNWRNRYEALCLHDPIFFDHMPYMPFPSTWPIYTPAKKLAGWLEHYAETMEIPVWTSSTLMSAVQDEKSKWELDIKRKDGSCQVLTTTHLVFATGMGDGAPKAFNYPGLNDRFKGEYLHSTQHKRAMDHVGKKVVVVGSATSAHDIAKDYCDHGIDVTMVQRGPTYVMSANPGWEFLFKGTYWEGGPPVDLVDRVRSASPRGAILGLVQRQVQKLAELDKKLLDGLRSTGFKLSHGERDAGFAWSVFSRAGGYYIDVGASQCIIDGKIKLKNDSTISEIDEDGLIFSDGSKLLADVIVFATGVGDAREVIRRVCGEDVADRIKPIWTFDAEGELGSVWRSSGVQNLWYAFSNLGLSRFHSKHLALQIKAIEEGLYREPYSLPSEHHKALSAYNNTAAIDHVTIHN